MYLTLLVMFFLFVIFFFLLLSLCLVLLNYSVICHCKPFSFIHLKYCSVVIPFSFPFYLSAFSISQSCYFVFYLFHSFQTCSHAHTEIRTNMHDKGIKRNVNANESPLCKAIAALSRTLYYTDRNH